MKKQLEPKEWFSRDWNEVAVVPTLLGKATVGAMLCPAEGYFLWNILFERPSSVFQRLHINCLLQQMLWLCPVNVSMLKFLYRRDVDYNRKNNNNNLFKAVRIRLTQLMGSELGVAPQDLMVSLMCVCFIYIFLEIITRRI